jgi:hypothetical protein
MVLDFTVSRSVSINGMEWGLQACYDCKVGSFVSCFSARSSLRTLWSGAGADISLASIFKKRRNLDKDVLVKKRLSCQLGRQNKNENFMILASKHFSFRIYISGGF